MKVTNKDRISCSVYKEIRERINELREEEFLSFNGMLLKLINTYEEVKEQNQQKEGKENDK